MEAFPTEDLAKDIRSLDLRQDNLPAQRSLGVFWDLETDAFTYKVSIPDKPLTRRGVLSVVNSVYDPLGLAAPVLLHGRLLLQQLVSMGKKKTATAPLGWDDPLPEELSLGWQSWKNALPDLQNVRYGDATTHRNLVQLPEPNCTHFQMQAKEPSVLLSIFAYSIAKKNILYPSCSARLK